MKRRLGLWTSIAIATSATSLAQDLNPTSLADRTCEAQPDSVVEWCVGEITHGYERVRRAFTAAHAVAPGVATASDQQNWLIELRKNCTERVCMRDALARRTLALRAIESRSFDAFDKTMTNAEVTQVCESVAEIESRGDIDDLLLPIGGLERSDFVAKNSANAEHNGQLEHQFELALHRGRRTSFGEYMSNGSCVTFTIEAIADDGSADDAKWPATVSVGSDQEELRLIGWGGSESVLSYRGRHYIATYGRWSHGIEYLEWLTPAATRRGLCTFEDTGAERIVAKRLDPSADCDALARAPVEDIGAQGSDLDNDGKSDPIVVGGEDSGAGCGRSWRNISFVDANGDVEASAQNDELRKLIGLENGPVKLLTLKGKRYVYAKNGDVPAAYSVTKTTVIPQCEFRIQYKRRMKTQFSFDSDTPEPP